MWLVEQFLCIFTQTAEQMEFKFGWLINYGTPQAWLIFGNFLLDFHHFMSLWYEEQSLCIRKHTADLIILKFGERTRDGTLQAWWSLPGIINF